VQLYILSGQNIRIFDVLDRMTYLLKRYKKEYVDLILYLRILLNHPVPQSTKCTAAILLSVPKVTANM